MDGIRATVEAGDLEAAFELLADGVVLRSPVDPEPYRGKPTAVGLAATGRDVFHFDDDGRVDALTVMVRPLPAAHALANAMKKEMRTP